MQPLGVLLLLLGAAILIYFRLSTRSVRRRGTAEAPTSLHRQVRELMYDANRDRHPAEEITDPRLAAAGIIVAIASMDQPITQSEIAIMREKIGEVFEAGDRDALDIVSFGRWIAAQFETPQEAVTLLSQIVAETAGPEAGPDLVEMIISVAGADGTAIGEEETAAVEEVRRQLGLS